MRRIFIDKAILDLALDYKDTLFEQRQSNFNRPKNKDGLNGRLFVLESYLRNDCNLHAEADYVKQIIDDYDNILILQPNNFISYNDNHFSLSEPNLKREISPPTGNTKFEKKKLFELIVGCMRYDAVRDKEFLPYLRKLRIKACVYCNAQFAITTEGKDGETSGKYELDHFFPKSKYPFLAISFFNLQPSCSQCNKSKKDNDSNFSLYTNDFNDLEPFSFSIEKRSLLRYLLTQNHDELIVQFECSDPELKKNHEDLFHISEIYAQHKDVIEEIIWKAKIYNKSYQESLSNAFKKHFSNASHFNRFILGNYDSPEKIHNRPLAKMVQDIARKLNLI